jgi:8-oxo-dGDP phosphatase
MSDKRNGDFAVIDTTTLFQGRIVGVREDVVRMPDGSEAKREIVAHLGAVVVVALDEAENVVLVRQYRPAVRAWLTELPAGLLDVDGEPPLEAAQRELAEEAQLSAATWHTLLDLHSSPGFSDETVRVYLARDLSAEDRPDGFVVEHEEVTMTVTREPLDTAVQRTLAGEITNAAAAAGVLAAAAARANGWRGLRAADLAWWTPDAEQAQQ